MRKVLVLLFSLFLVTALAACGDDGGDAEEASDTLCEDDVIDALDELFNGDDVPDFDEGRDALDVVAEAADGDLDDQVDTVQDAIDDVEEALEGVDEDDDEAVAEALGDAFEDFDQEAFDEDSDDITDFVDDECDSELSDDSGSDDTTDTSESTDTTDDSDSGSGEDTSLEDFAELVESCEDGDMADCDQLFFDTPLESEAEDVGATCGGRVDRGEIPAGTCEEEFG